MTAMTLPRSSGDASPPHGANANVYGWVRIADALVKSVRLGRGNVLRIRDGRGMQLTPASGVIWITEERSANDTVLLPGSMHRIDNPGTALVVAHRAARIVLEVPAGTPVPRRVDFAVAEGASGRAIALDRRGLAARRILPALAAAWRDAMGVMRAFWRARAAAAPRPSLPYY